MGAGQSVSQYVSNNLEFSQTTNVLNEVSSSSSVSATVYANVSIIFEVDDLTFNGDINVSQFANVDLKTYSVNESGLKADQVADLQNSVTNDCKTMLDRANEDFGAVLGAAQGGQSSNTTIMNAIKQAVTQNVTQRTVTDLLAQATVDASSDLLFKAKKLVFNGNIDVGQTIIITLVSQLMVQSVVDAVLETTAVNNIANKVEDEITATNTGVATIVESVGDAIGNILKSSQLLFVVIGIVAVVGIYLYLQKGGKVPFLSRGAKAMPGARPMGQRPPSRVMEMNPALYGTPNFMQGYAPSAAPYAPSAAPYAPYGNSAAYAPYPGSPAPSAQYPGVSAPYAPYPGSAAPNAPYPAPYAPTEISAAPYVPSSAPFSPSAPPSLPAV